MPAPRSSQENHWKKKVRCPSEHLVLFLRQLSIMINTGVPLIDSLDTLSHQDEYPRFGRAVNEMSNLLAAGHSLSNAMGQFPRLFTGVHIAMITTGERTGALARSLDQLAGWGERDNKLYRDVKGAFTYPAVVFVVAVVLTVGLFLTVIPGFVTMFEERGMELPLVTKIVVGITNMVANPGCWLLAGGLSLAAYLSLREALKTDSGALRAAQALCQIPGVGGLIRLATAARYCNVLGTLLNSGLDLLGSLRLAATASGNPIYSNDARRLMDDVQHGESLAVAMHSRPHVYLPMVVEMVTVGEETSNLSEMFSQTARFLDEQVGFQVEALSAALEPLMLVFVSCLVGSILLAIILPLYGFLNQLGL